MALELQIQPRQTERTCPWCHDDLIDGVVTCSGCATGYHVECVGEAKVCGITGCRRPLPGLQSEARLPAPQLDQPVVGVLRPEPVGFNSQAVDSWLAFLGEASLVLFLLALAAFFLPASYASYTSEPREGPLGITFLLIGLISVYTAGSWLFAKIKAL